MKKDGEILGKICPHFTVFKPADTQCGAVISFGVAWDVAGKQGMSLMAKTQND
jgi:hypothetical protein